MRIAAVRPWRLTHASAFRRVVALAAALGIAFVAIPTRVSATEEGDPPTSPPTAVIAHRPIGPEAAGLAFEERARGPAPGNAAAPAGPIERSLATYVERLTADRGAARSLAARSTTQANPGSGGHGAGFWVGVGAGAGLLTAVIANASPSCREPESLCPIAYVTFPAFGALIGFMIGA